MRVDKAFAHITNIFCPESLSIFKRFVNDSIGLLFKFLIFLGIISNKCKKIGFKIGFSNITVHISKPIFIARIDFRISSGSYIYKFVIPTKPFSGINKFQYRFVFKHIDIIILSTIYNKQIGNLHIIKNIACIPYNIARFVILNLIISVCSDTLPHLFR